MKRDMRWRLFGKFSSYPIAYKFEFEKNFKFYGTYIIIASVIKKQHNRNNSPHSLFSFSPLFLLFAKREGVRIHGVGVFVFVIIPGAFVDLSTEQVTNLPIWNQLKIFCAGVWHNISLAGVAVLLLLSNPLILSPFYTQHQGAVVAYVDPVSLKRLLTVDV